MKICVLNNYFYPRGGAETVMLAEMRGLALRGHEVIPFSQRHPMNAPSFHAAWFPPFHDLTRLGLWHKARAALRIVWNQTARARFGQLLDQVSPDVIHAHNIYGGLTTGVLAAARSRSVPVVMTLHDYKLVCPSYQQLADGRPCFACRGGQFYHCLLRRCHKGLFSASAVYTLESYFNRWTDGYGWVDRFIAPSRFLRDQLVAAGWTGTRLVHLPNPACAVAVEESSEEASSGEYVAYIGRLSPEKGILTLLEAFEGLRVRLRMVGEGPLRAHVEGVIRERRLENVQLMGFLRGAALQQALHGARFVVLPSIWNENFPMSLLEAFALGKTAVASRIGGIPEMVQDQRTGLLVEPGDVVGLRRGVQRLWEDRGLAERLGANAKAWAEGTLSLEVHCAELETLYQDAIRRVRVFKR